jgi:nucleotide-binding universal stress UspA family protein
VAFKKIIVGMDFSTTSQRAARVAVELARPLGASVVLVHVLAPGPAYADPARIVPAVRPGIEARIRPFAEQLSSEGGVPVDWGVVDGDAARELATFAARWDGDLIVVGTRARTGLARALLGSVLERLLQVTPVPVLAIAPEWT